MWTRHHKRRRTGRLIVPAITIVVLSYFSFHAFHGDYGLNAKAQMEMRLQVLEAALKVQETTRIELETRLALLSDGSLEKDMLDEHIRRNLNQAKPNELVVFRRSVN